MSTKKKSRHKKKRQHREFPELISEEVDTIYSRVQKVSRLPLAPYYEKTVFPWQKVTWDVPPEETTLQQMLAETALKEGADLAGLVYVAPEDLRDMNLFVGKIGCGVHVETTEKMVDGTLLVKMNGLCRFTVKGDFEVENDYITAAIEWFDDEEEVNPKSRNRPALLKELRHANRNLWRIYKMMDGKLSLDEYLPESFNDINGAHMSSFFFLSMLNYFSHEQRIKFTEMRSTLMRLHFVNLQMDLILDIVEGNAPTRNIAKYN